MTSSGEDNRNNKKRNNKLATRRRKQEKLWKDNELKTHTEIKTSTEQREELRAAKEMAEIEHEYLFLSVRTTDAENVPQTPDRVTLLRRAQCAIQCKYALMSCSNMCEHGRASAITPLMAELVSLPPSIQKNVISFFNVPPPSSTIYKPCIVPGIYVSSRCHPCCLGTTVLFLYPGFKIANYDDLWCWCRNHGGYCRYISHDISEGATRLMERAERVQSLYQKMTGSGEFAKASLLKDDWYNATELIDYAMNPYFRKFKARCSDDGRRIEISHGYGTRFLIKVWTEGNGSYTLLERRDDGDRIFRLVVPF